jgi:hypothetical protein
MEMGHGGAPSSILAETQNCFGLWFSNLFVVSLSVLNSTVSSGEISEQITVFVIDFGC